MTHPEYVEQNSDQEIPIMSNPDMTVGQAEAAVKKAQMEWESAERAADAAEGTSIYDTRAQIADEKAKKLSDAQATLAKIKGESKEPHSPGEAVGPGQTVNLEGEEAVGPEGN